MAGIVTSTATGTTAELDTATGTVGGAGADAPGLTSKATGATAGFAPLENNQKAPAPANTMAPKMPPGTRYLVLPDWGAEAVLLAFWGSGLGLGWAAAGAGTGTGGGVGAGMDAGAAALGGMTDVSSGTATGMESIGGAGSTANPGSDASAKAGDGGTLTMGGVTGTSGVAGVPQDLQNFAVTALIALHWLQAIPEASVCTGAAANAVRTSQPQDLQNLAVSELAVAHFGQFVAINFLVARGR